MWRALASHGTKPANLLYVNRETLSPLESFGLLTLDTGPLPSVIDSNVLLNNVFLAKSFLVYSAQHNANNKRRWGGQEKEGNDRHRSGKASTRSPQRALEQPVKAHGAPVQLEPKPVSLRGRCQSANEVDATSLARRSRRGEGRTNKTKRQRGAQIRRRSRRTAPRCKARSCDAPASPRAQEGAKAAAAHTHTKAPRTPPNTDRATQPTRPTSAGTRKEGAQPATPRGQTPNHRRPHRAAKRPTHPRATSPLTARLVDQRAPTRHRTREPLALEGASGQPALTPFAGRQKCAGQSQGPSGR